MVDPEAGERRYELKMAINDLAEAEWGASIGEFRRELLGDKYGRAMDACAATGDVPKKSVCWYTKNLVERRMWELYGRPQGLPRSDFKIPHTMWYEKGRELGYTDPAYDRRGHHKGEERKVVLAPGKPKKAETFQYSTQNRRYINSFNVAGDAMHVVAEWLCKFPVEGNVDREYAETAVAVLEAFAKNIHDLGSARRVVPGNAQQLFVEATISTLSSDEFIRKFYTAIATLTTFRAKKKGGKGKFLAAPEINKYVHRHVRDLHISLEPAGTFEAQWLGFHGQRCSKCQSWRCHGMAASMDVVECVRCGAQSPRLATVFCRMCHYRLPHDADKCGHCGNKINNPNKAPSAEGGT